MFILLNFVIGMNAKLVWLSDRMWTLKNVQSIPKKWAQMGKSAQKFHFYPYPSSPDTIRPLGPVRIAVGTIQLAIEYSRLAVDSAQPYKLPLFDWTVLGLFYPNSLPILSHCIGDLCNMLWAIVCPIQLTYW